MSKAIVTRFAPSPSGYLHLGHAYSALFAERAAKRAGGRFLLRIEDIDGARCKPEYEDAIFEDLAWLGLHWDQPVRRQSDQMALYAGGLEKLDRMGLTYPCFCSRKEIRKEIEAAGNAPHKGGHGPVYPGTCRRLYSDDRDIRIFAGDPYAVRLNVRKALAMALAPSLAEDLTWTDLDAGEIKATPEDFGDVVLARKDDPTSYHLSVTLDDHAQDITLVTRGSDLRDVTHIHRLLQALLGLATPDYRFHQLLTDQSGRRYAKRDKAQTLRALRDSGKTPDDVRQMIEV